MPPTPGARRQPSRSLISLLVALVSFTLAGIGLRHLTLGPGMPLPSFEHGHVVFAASDGAAVGVSVSALARAAILVVVGAPALFLIIQLVRGVPWKRLLAGTGGLFWKLLLAAAVLALAVILLPRSRAASSAEALPAPIFPATAPLGPVPSALIWMVGACVVGTAVLAGIRVILARRDTAAEPLVVEVDRARQALRDGRDLREVILQCYRRMSQGRESFMTTGEFEQVMTARGVPTGPVHQLTRLFEAARYSRWEPAPGDEQAAIACLEAILLFSRSTAKER